MQPERNLHSVRRPGDCSCRLTVHTHICDSGAQVVYLQHRAPVECGKADSLAKRGPTGEEGHALRGEVYDGAIGFASWLNVIRHTRDVKLGRVTIKDLAVVPVLLLQLSCSHAKVADQVHTFQFRITREHTAEHDLIPARLHGGADVHLAERNVCPPAGILAGDRLPVDDDGKAFG